MIGATTPEGNEPPQRDERIPSRIATGRARWRLRRLAHMSKNRWCFDTFLRSVDPGDRSRRRVARRIRNVVDAGIAKRRTAAVYLGQLCDAGVLDEVKVGREKLFINPRRVTPSLLPQSERPDLPQSAEHQIRRAVRVLGVVQVAREDVFKVVAGIGVVGTPVRFPRDDCRPPGSTSRSEYAAVATRPSTSVVGRASSKGGSVWSSGADRTPDEHDPRREIAQGLRHALQPLDGRMAQDVRCDPAHACPDSIASRAARAAVRSRACPTLNASTSVRAL